MMNEKGTLTINQAKQDAQRMGDDILKLLREYQKLHGLLPTAIDLEFYESQPIGEEKRVELTRVQVTVEL
jgi:hypothetical protein